MDTAYDAIANAPDFARDIANGLATLTRGMPTCVKNALIDKYHDKVLEELGELIGAKLVIGQLNSALLVGRERLMSRRIGGAVGIGIACSAYSMYGRIERLQERLEQLKADNPALADQLGDNMQTAYGLLPEVFSALSSELAGNIADLVAKYCQPCPNSSTPPQRPVPPAWTDPRGPRIPPPSLRD